MLHVRFLGGDPLIRRRVEACALEWCRYGALELLFDNAPDAQLRVGFGSGASWSLLGTDALHPSISPDEPTINFGWLTSAVPNDEFIAVVLHEFGHALGLIHEHQSPASSIPWNKDAVYAFYSGPPNFWSREEIERNIFARYATSETNSSAFDPLSIMSYAIPQEFTDGSFTIGINRSLSATDRRHFGCIYPFPVG